MYRLRKRLFSVVSCDYNNIAAGPEVTMNKPINLKLQVNDIDEKFQSDSRSLLKKVFNKLESQALVNFKYTGNKFQYEYSESLLIEKTERVYLKGLHKPSEQRRLGDCWWDGLQ